MSSIHELNGVAPAQTPEIDRAAYAAAQREVRAALSTCILPTMTTPTVAPMVEMTPVETTPEIDPGVAALVAARAPNHTVEMYIASRAAGHTPEVAAGHAANAATHDQPQRGIANPHGLALGYLGMHRTDQCRRAHGASPDTHLLRRYRGEWWEYAGGRWRVVSDETVRAAISGHCDTALQIAWQAEMGPWVVAASGAKNKKPKPVVAPVTTSLVGNVVEALRSIPGVLVGDDVEQPCWLDGETGPDPRDVVATADCLVHVPTLSTSPLTPLYFSPVSLDYGFAAQAATPTRPDRWLRLMSEIWGDDHESVELLQDWMGYCLTADTSLQRMLLLVGPPRSGKGTIARILERLLGPANVASIDMTSLATGRFALAPLVGKRLAIVQDARLSGRADQAPIAERLLSISGEDAVLVDRKGISAITTRMTARVMIITNELPRLGETSGALARRFTVLRTVRSFAGREDTTLEAQMTAELPAILRWAAEGLDRLRQRGRLIQPSMSQDAVDDLADLSSPVMRWVDERCALDTNYVTTIRDLYADWVTWCAQTGYIAIGSDATLARDLRAGYPALRVERPRTDGPRRRLYRGIGLRSRVLPTPTSPPGDPGPGTVDQPRLRERLYGSQIDS